MNEKNKIRQWWIYKITNPNGRVYIGRTCYIDTRFRFYVKPTKKGSQQPIIFNSINKYGFDNHKVEVIDNFFGDKTLADAKEIFWIRSYMSNRHKFPQQNGMNCTDGGGGTLGSIRSESSRKKSSDSHKGQPASEYQRQRASEVHKGNKWRLGKISSQETIEKIRQGNLGKKVADTSLIRENNIKLRGRPIVQYDFNDNIIGEFRTTVEATEKLKICGRTVLDSLQGRKLQFKKCYFKYK